MIITLETYRGGYKKALLDMKNLVENRDVTCIAKSKKQFQNLIISCLDLLLQNPEVLDSMMETGLPEMAITKDCTCLPAKARGKK